MEQQKENALDKPPRSDVVIDTPISSLVPTNIRIRPGDEIRYDGISEMRIAPVFPFVRAQLSNIASVGDTPSLSRIGAARIQRAPKIIPGMIRIITPIAVGMPVKITRLKNEIIPALVELIPQLFIKCRMM